MQQTPTRPETHPSAIDNWEDQVDALFQEIFRPRPHISVSEWAEANRVLSSETSSEPGPWRNDRAPYLIEIMNALSDPEVTEMVIMKSARVGYTEGIVGNGIGYFVDQDPCPILILQPAEGDAEDWSKKQLAPLLRDCKVLSDKFPAPGTRDSNNTILDKIWTGGSITIRGAHSPRGLRRLTIRVVFFDEVSAFEVSAGSEGDPVKLGEARTATYPNRKLVKGSTPIDKARCRITRDFERSDQRRWYVPCPHCSHEQVLQWGGPDTAYGIKWEKDVSCERCTTPWVEDEKKCKCGCAERAVKHLPDTAYYLCESCASPIEEVHKDWMVQRGRYIRTNPASKVAGWHVNALVSLISDKARWPNIVQEWLDAQENPALLQVFVNTVLGEPWEDRGEKFSPEQLAARAALWLDPISQKPVDVPDGVGLLTAFVDVQGDRLEIEIRGWGEKQESWGILHHRIMRPALDPEAWQQLEAIRTRQYVHQSGAVMRIHTTLVDAGYETGTVLAYVRGRESQGVFASVGRAGKGPWVNRASKANKDGVKLFTIKVDGMKDVLISRLKIGKPGPGYMHFSRPDQDRFNGYDAEFFAQYGREKKVAKKGRSKAGEYEWIKTGRNEAIDLAVGNMAALHINAPAVREQLGDRAREISKRGERHKELVTQPMKRRRTISKGIR